MLKADSKKVHALPFGVERHYLVQIPERVSSGKERACKQDASSLLSEEEINTSKSEDAETLHSISTIDQEKQSSEDNLSGDSGISNQSPEMERSNSQETLFSEPWDREKTEQDLLAVFNNIILSVDQAVQCEISTENNKSSRSSLRRVFSEGDLYSLSNNINSTHSINSIQESFKRSFSDKSVQTSPIFQENDASEVNSVINIEKKTNKIWPRIKHALQEKGFIVCSISAAILYMSLALAYFQNKAKFLEFFTNSRLYIAIGLISILAIGGIFCAVKQFINTEEHQTQEKDADKILDGVLAYQPKNKAIKSVRLEYGNGTHSNFTLNAWEAKNGFIDIDKKVISRTDKIGSIISNRPLFTALLTCAVAANIALPIGLLTTGGMEGLKRFYQGCLTNKVGLSLLIGSCILLLSVVCLGIHYYRKTNCNNRTYSEEKIDTENINKKFIEEIKQERTKVLEENHGKDAKRSSLTLKQVVVESHNYKDAIYTMNA